MNCIYNNKVYLEKLQERFIRYVKIWSESSSAQADKGVFPSTERQWDMARTLEKELISLGLKDVQITDKCYVYACLPSSEGFENKDSILLLAHMDTVEEVTGKDVKPQIFADYDGKLIELNDGVKQDINTDKNLKLAAANRETIITSDGTTLLGADDKAGVSAIMQALEFLKENEKEYKHCQIEVIFSPDEETGHGMDYVPLNLIKSKCAYTVDGGHIGELESECFNAFSAEVTFTGKACHTGYAKENKMINAIVMASYFTSRIPSFLLPENSEKREGFTSPMELTGSIDKAKLNLILRAFTMKQIEQEKQVLLNLSKRTENKYGGKIQIEYKKQYLNMKDELDKHPQVLEKLLQSFEACNVLPVQNPIRGGTDGSRLTEIGIPTPNIFTGAHNFHSRYEWVSLNQMAKASDILINLVTQ